MTTAEKTMRRVVALDEAALALPSGPPRAKVEQVADGLVADVNNAVPKAVAARILGLSVPTVDRWIEAGRLRTIDVNGRALVEARHLGRVAAAVRSLRAASRTRGMITAVIDRISREDPKLQLELADLQESLDAVRSGELVDLTFPATFGPDD